MSRKILAEKVLAGKTGRVISIEAIRQFQTPVTTSLTINRRLSFLTPTQMSNLAKFLEDDFIDIKEVKTLKELEKLITKSKIFENVNIPVQIDILRDIATMIKNVATPDRALIITKLIEDIFILGVEDALNPVELAKFSVILSDSEGQKGILKDLLKEFDTIATNIVTRDTTLEDELRNALQRFKKLMKTDQKKAFEDFKILKDKQDDIDEDDIDALFSSKKVVIQEEEEIILTTGTKPFTNNPKFNSLFETILNPVTKISLLTPRNGHLKGVGEKEKAKRIYEFDYGQDSQIIINLKSGLVKFRIDRKFKKDLQFNFKTLPLLWKLIATPFLRQGTNPEFLSDFNTEDKILKEFEEFNLFRFREIVAQLGITGEEPDDDKIQKFLNLIPKFGSGFQQLPFPMNANILPDQDLTTPAKNLHPIVTIDVNPSKNKFLKRGSGTAKFKPFIIEIDPNDPTVGNFGILDINLPRLLGFRRLIAFDQQNKKIFDQNVDISFISLVTKRFSTKMKFTDKAIRLFRKFVIASKIQINPKDKKSQLLIARVRGKTLKTGQGKHKGGQVLVINKPEEAFDKLQMILAEIKLGNTSDNNKNLAISINDFLLKNNEFDKSTHKKVNQMIMI